MTEEEKRAVMKEMGKKGAAARAAKLGKERVAEIARENGKRSGGRPVVEAEPSGGTAVAIEGEEKVSVKRVITKRDHGPKTRAERAADDGSKMVRDPEGWGDVFG